MGLLLATNHPAFYRCFALGWRPSKQCSRLYRDREMLQRGQQSLNSIQLLQSRPFQYQRQMLKVRQMSHSTVSGLGGTCKFTRATEAIACHQPTRHSTNDTQTSGNCLGIFGNLASELAVAEDEMWMLDAVCLAPRASYRASRFELVLTRQEACR